MDLIQSIEALRANIWFLKKKKKKEILTQYCNIEILSEFPTCLKDFLLASPYYIARANFLKLINLNFSLSPPRYLSLTFPLSPSPHIPLVLFL